MATTTNFGWETPDDTDLVKDGALAMRTLGNAIDASLVDLKGGTTGQVLSKNSNTDMDFTWVTSDDANAIQNDIVDAKGDLIAASAADTPARLAVGNNGETLLADSSTSTGLRWQPTFAAGKNKIINGDFGIWQRGTSFTTGGGFLADRWRYDNDGSGTRAQSQQTFTPGTAPVAGYEGQYFQRVAHTVAGSGATYNSLAQAIEDVRTLAGQTATISFWVKAAANTTLPAVKVNQNFGSGGSSLVSTSVTTNIAVTTSWQRFSYTVSVPSVSGKTIGTSSFLNLVIDLPLNATYTLDFWGVQVEVGSVATAFQTATGTLAGELAACQRYYIRYQSDASNNIQSFGNGSARATTFAYQVTNFPVEMRTAPNGYLDYGASLELWDGVNAATAVTSVTTDAASTKMARFTANTASGLTQYRPYTLRAATSSSAYIAFSAEL